MTNRRALVQLWLASLVTTATAHASPVHLRSLFSQQRSLQDENTHDNIWGYQQGSANGHSDAGGMLYDAKRDEIILVGTTHDNQFFDDGGANSVDCFIATIQLPDIADELDAKEAAVLDPTVLETAEQERVRWTLSGKHRVATPNSLDRCDLIAAVWGDSTAATHDHTFVGGTLAINQNANRDAIAVQPKLYELSVKNLNNDDTEIETGQALKVFEAAPIGTTINGAPVGGVAKKNDIIIPAMMTGHQHEVYIASIHRILVMNQADIGTPNAAPKLQISLGIAKYKVNDNANGNANSTLVKEWSHIEPTTILEVKADEIPHVTSGMFHHQGGLDPKEQHELELEQQQIEQEISGMEEAEEEYEEESMQMDMHRHEYKNDGVLISGLEMVEMSADESYLLIAGSAPGTKKDQMGQYNNHTTTGSNSQHPFMPHAPGYQSKIGDWDGYVAKLNPRTGTVAVQQNTEINTWGYRLHTQAQRNDFIQSICVPKIPEMLNTNPNEKFYPTVVYAVGTTTGKLVGDQYGGAFIVQIDLASMDILWKQQLPGMNVHGLSCEVLVDAASAGSIRADSKDLIYIAGEVHGNMKVPMADGTTVLTHGHGETDVFVAQLRASDGMVTWVQQVGTTQQDRLAKNVNNPSVSDGEQESEIGDTGSGKGALVLDREGNAIIYGTTNGSLGRTKTNGDRFRDIFVVRLHRDDGSYKAIVEPHTFITESTPAPIGSGGGSSSTPSGTSSSSSSTAQQSTYTPPSPTHGGADTDTSINIGIVIAGLAVPIILGIGIIMATNNKSQNRMPPMEMDSAGTDLHVDFPSAQDSSPPTNTFPPGVEQSLEMSPTTKTQPTTENFGVL